jgi:hypothetical protein
LSAIRAGFAGALRIWPAAVWMYLVTAFSAFPVFLAVAFLTFEGTAKIVDAAEVAAGFDPVILFSLLLKNQRALRAILPMFAGIVVLWVVASTYLSGATIAAVSRRDTTSTHELMTGGGRVFGRLLRLLIFGGPFWVLTVGLCAYGLFKGTEALTRDMISERGAFALRAGSTFLAAMIVVWTSGALDQMRIEAVARGEHRARYAFWRGLQRAVLHPWVVFRTTAAFTAAMVSLTLLWSLCEVHIPRSSLILVLMIFLIQQALAFSRAFLRVATFAAAVELSASALFRTRKSSAVSTPGSATARPG